MVRALVNRSQPIKIRHSAIDYYSGRARVPSFFMNICINNTLFFCVDLSDLNPLKKRQDYTQPCEAWPCGAAFGARGYIVTQSRLVSHYPPGFSVFSFPFLYFFEAE